MKTPKPLAIKGKERWCSLLRLRHRVAPDVQVTARGASYVDDESAPNDAQSAALMSGHEVFALQLVSAFSLPLNLNWILRGTKRRRKRHRNDGTP